MTGSLELKKALYHACIDLVQQRIDNARQALLAAEEAGKEETKSSVGDKYETGRAMMQQEQEKYKVQLLQALQLKNELAAITPDRICEKVEPGSLVFTNAGKFYISIGTGRINLANDIFFAISLASPIGTALNGKRQGETGSFQGKQYLILQVI